MLQLEISTIDTSLERQILIGSIVSTNFLKNIQPIYQPHYLNSVYSRRIMGWVLDYYNSQSTAPGINIRNIFEIHKHLIDQSEVPLIETFLLHLSEDYTKMESLNVDYMESNALRYFKKRELEFTAKAMLALLAKDKVEDAEAALADYKKVGKLTSKWYNPFDLKHIVTAFDQEDNRVLNFPNKLGDFVGGLELSWLVMIAGGYKRGKSWWAQELAFLAMTSYLPVAYLNFEMRDRSQNLRLYKRILGFGKQEGPVVYPVFDCTHNQTGICNKAERTNAFPLLNEEGEKPAFDLEMEYRPCTWCRTNAVRDFKTDTWFTVYERPAFNFGNAYDRLSTFGEMIGNGMIMINCYPRFSATVEQGIRDLDILEHNHGFIPKVIVWDYPGITKPTHRKNSDWEEQDETWMTLGGLATERNCLVIAPSQITTEGIMATSLKQNNIGRARGILGHVDAAFSINQIPDEKRRGITRLGKLIHRHDDFDEEMEAMVLQNIAIGAVELDSEIIRM